MKPSISEFSFGYAVTEEIVKRQRIYMTSAPIFPSLREEGQPGGGYDVQIQRLGFPLFVQFKLSHEMIRSNCKEVRNGYLTAPFFRIYLMPQRLSLQHKMLLDLDDGTNEVYYIAPFFGSQSVLNQHYLSNTVLENCFIMAPSIIGELPDDEEHHISLRQAGSIFRFSIQPKILEGKPNAEQFLVNLRQRLNSEKQSMSNNLMQTIQKMETIISKNRYKMKAINTDIINNSFERTAYLARYYFDCETIFIFK